MKGTVKIIQGTRCYEVLHRRHFWQRWQPLTYLNSNKQMTFTCWTEFIELLQPGRLDYVKIKAGRVVGRPLYDKAPAHGQPFTTKRWAEILDAAKKRMRLFSWRNGHTSAFDAFVDGAQWADAHRSEEPADPPMRVPRSVQPITNPVILSTVRAVEKKYQAYFASKEPYITPSTNMSNYFQHAALNCENESLRERYRQIKEKATALSEAVDKYTHQGISRSMLLHIKDDLDKTINQRLTKA